MTPEERLPLAVREDIERYRSYHWKPGLILELVCRRHGLRLPRRCLKALEEGGPCPRGCRELCRVDRAAPPVPALPDPPSSPARASVPPLSSYLKK